MSFTTLSTAKEEKKQQKENNDPFKSLALDDIVVDDTLFDQPPATRLELWSYYLYYNGVRKANNTFTAPSYQLTILCRIMDIQSIVICHLYFNI
jgi:hypothetical protein